MTDIDWTAVWNVCTGASMELYPDEKRMAVRRMAERMTNNLDTPYTSAGKLSSSEVARRLRTTERSIERLKAELPAAVKETCPVCRQPMWTYSGVIEPHPDALLQECPFTRTLTGLAAIRPDLYQWVIA